MFRKTLSGVLAAAVAGVSLTVPIAAASATTEPQGPDLEEAVRAAEVPQPTVEAQGSDHQKDNRTWRQLKVNWDWVMPDGIPATNDAYIPQTPMGPVPGYPQAGNALYGPLPDGANPEYQVVLNADGTNIKGRTKKLLCEWEIASPTPVEVGASNCTRTQTVLLPEGTFPLTLTVTDRKSGVSKTVTSEIQVLNVLFSISGDSYAAGEGYPPFSETINGKKYLAWDEPGCDRSRWSGFVRAAAMAEQADPRSNVTLVDVACSGADVLEQEDAPLVTPTGGMLSPQKVKVQPGDATQSSVYSGNPANPGFFPPQVDQLTAIAQGKAYDVTLFSIGGNDAGLGPIVTSCLMFDTLSVLGEQILAGKGSQGTGLFAQDGIYNFQDAVTIPPNYAMYPGCYANGQAALDISSLGGGGLTDLSAECTGWGLEFPSKDPNPIVAAAEDLIALATLLKGCQDAVDKDDNPLYPASALYNEADDNLLALEQEYAQLAPCFGATGGAATCQTFKTATLNDKGQTVPGDRSPSDPVKTAGINTVGQAMYPDLTQKSNGSGGLEFCSVQQDPTKAAGAELQPGPNFGWPDPLGTGSLTDIILPSAAEALQNPLMSPMNQISNEWAFKQFYEGRANNKFALKTGADFPQNTPRLFDVSYPMFAGDPGTGENPDWGPADGWGSPTTLTPKADGLVAQLAYNEGVYGWRAGMSMYQASHPYGLCASDRWVTNLTDYIVGEVTYNGTGVGLHPNEAGQMAYADMLGPMAIDMAGLPVVKAADAVVPLGDGVATKTKVKLPKNPVKSGTRAAVKVRVTGAVLAQAAEVPGLKGRIEIRGNKKGTSRWMKQIVPVKANGKKTAKLPKSWTKLAKNRNKSNIRLRVRYLGNPTYQASNAKQVKLRIVRGAVQQRGRG